MEQPPDKKALMELAIARMPFGKHKGKLLIDVPESYFIWLSTQGLPKGKLGDQIKAVMAIKENGLEYLFRPIRTAPKPKIPSRKDMLLGKVKFLTD